MRKDIRPRTSRRWSFWFFGGLAVVVVLGAAAAVFWLRGAIYNRYVRFPRQAVAWENLRAQRQTVADNVGWLEFRGICHSHSELSHDCEVPFTEILKAMKVAGVDFICLSDHCDDGRADFSRQWRGLRDGKLFIPGFEMRDGFMPFGVASGVVLSNRTSSAALARAIASNGGVFFYAHPEEARDWGRPELTGMEIYNLHADFKRRPRPVRELLPDILLSFRRYPDHLYSLVFQRPEGYLKQWDDLNRRRHITGIAGNDCHQNVGIRVFYTKDGTLRVEDTSPQILKEWELNWATRPLARWIFGSLEPGLLFHAQLDAYERSARFVNTHVLARDLTEAGILDALRTGRVFVGFDSIVDSTSFRWYAQQGTTVALMGEELGWSNSTRLRVRSPVPCRFTLVRDGEVIQRTEGRAADWTAPTPGKYRIEAEVSVMGEWVPWVYANPISLR